MKPTMMGLIGPMALLLATLMAVANASSDRKAAIQKRVESLQPMKRVPPPFRQTRPK